MCAKKLPAWTLCVILSLLALPAEAVPIFSQTPPIVAASPSDVETLIQHADNFSLAAPATVRSATWRGVFNDFNSATFPVPFTLTIYGNTFSGGNPIPDVGNIISTTNVSFSPGQFTDTNTDLVVGNLTFDIYEFQANLPPAALAAATTYWFSVLADTTGDPPANNWAWARGAFATGDGTALRQVSPFVGNFSHSANGGPFYFVLDDVALSAVPEAGPLFVWTALGAVGAVGLVIRRRR
jgi:hypothetical protein